MYSIYSLLLLLGIVTHNEFLNNWKYLMANFFNSIFWGKKFVQLYEHKNILHKQNLLRTLFKQLQT